MKSWCDYQIWSAANNNKGAKAIGMGIQFSKGTHDTFWLCLFVSRPEQLHRSHKKYNDIIQRSTTITKNITPYQDLLLLHYKA